MTRFSFYRAFLIATIIAICGAPHTLDAQATVQNAVLFGTVTDSSGATVPGATVEVTSPALQDKKTATTDGSGNYRIPDLPVGNYRIRYTMTGFQTEVRNDLSLTSGFSARLDISLKPGAVTQTVEVTEASPLVDTETTSVNATVESAVLQTLPSTRQLADAAYLIPGVRPTNTPDVGGSQLGNLLSIGAYGFGANGMPMADGVDVLQVGSERGGPLGASQGQLIDYDSLAVVEVITTGGQADIAEAGPVTIATTKSGGNRFHGAAHIFYEPHWFQATNLPASAAGGGSAANQLQYFYDYEGDVGGKIIKDRLWFWAGFHPEQNNYAIFGFIGPNGGQGYLKTVQDDVDTRIDYHVTKSISFIAHYQWSNKDQPTFGGGPTIPNADSTYTYNTNFANMKGEIIWTPNSKWVVDLLGGYKTQVFHYIQPPGSDVPGNPYTVNQTTGVTTGARFNVSSSDNGAHNRKVYTASASWFPNGKHSIQFGGQSFWPEVDAANYHIHAAGNYQLTTKNATAPATGVVPFQLLAYNFPLSVTGDQTAIGGYVKDSWRASKRLTLNFGARFDHYHVFNPAETAPSGPFSLGSSTPHLDVGTWNRVVPRVGAAYDLTGSGKTVIRASYGMYSVPFIGIFDSGGFNPIGKSDNVYNWAGDTCQVTQYSACTPSAAFLGAIAASLANPAATTFNGKNIYVSTTSNALATVNPDLRMPYLHQFSMEVQHELLPNFAVSAVYVYQLEEDMYDQIYPNRPISAYTLPYNTVYPATDPVNGGKPLTIYTYPQSLVSANQTEVVTRTKNPDFYNAIGVSLTKRMVKKWGAGVSLDFIKDHTYISAAPTFPAFSSGITESGENPAAPYQIPFPLDLTWDTTVKAYLVYNLPFKTSLGLNYMFLAGTPAYTTDQVSVPASTINGIASASLGTVTFPVNQFGSDRQPAQNLLNVRVAKIIPIEKRGSLELTVELFNALNVAPAETVNYLNGTGATAFGFQSAFMPPLIGRFGAKFTF